MTSTMIRFAQESDAHHIAAIHVASWQKIYRGLIPDSTLNNLSVVEKEKLWLALIKNHSQILIIDIDQQMVGFASIGATRDTDADAAKCGEIMAIYLHPDYWRQGIGAMLCEKAFSELKEKGFSEVTAWVLQGNALARKFYEKIGFEETTDIKADEFDSGVVLDEVRYRRKL